MSEDTAVYDLGEVEQSPAARVSPRLRATPLTAPSASRRAPATRAVGIRPIDAITDSLELFVPGTGQLLRAQWSDGLFALSVTGCLVALAWAVWETQDRLSGALTALGYSSHGAVYALALIYAGLAGIHAGNVLSGTTRGPGRAHPAIAGVASALLPGWGQLLNRQPAKASAFIVGLWIVGFTWLLASPGTVALFETQGIAFRPGFAALSSSIVVWTVPIVLWVLSVYDAVATSRR